MHKPLQATCDNCHQISKVSIKKRYHPKTIQETYFNCQHCNKHYMCYVTDRKVRVLQKQKDTVSKWDIQTREHLQSQINQRMNKLKSELIGIV